MSLQVLMAPPACGKTQFGIQAVRESLTGAGLKNIWVLVPDRRQKEIFRQRLVQAGGMLGVTVDTFDAVCARILLDTGNLLPLADLALQHRLIRTNITTLFNRQALEVFTPIREKPGFLGLLHGYFQELQLAGVNPDDKNLQPWVNSDEQVRILIRLYAAYLQDLQRYGWQDRNGIITAALDVMKKTDYHPALDLVVIDGFERFSRPQRQLISMLSTQKTRVLITLTGEPDSDRLVYRRTFKTLQILRTDHPDLELIYIDKQCFLPQAVEGLERGFLNDNAGNRIEGDDLTLLEVQSPVQEVREALRRIKKEYISAVNIPLRSAMVVPDLDLYRPLIRAVANEFGMTVHFNQQELLNKHPGISPVLEMLSLKTENFPRRVLIDVLRSPYFDLSAFELTPHDAARMELVSRYGPVIAGLDRWQEVLARLAASQSSAVHSGDEEDDTLTFQLPNGEAVERLSRALSALAAGFDLPHGDQTIDFWVQWLSAMLEKWQWPQCCNVAGQAALVTSFAGILDGLRLTALELGEWRLNFTQFVQELAALLAIKELPEIGVQNPASVEILQMIEARSVRYDMVAVVGLAEGSYPQVERADPFFGEAFRSAFEMEQRLEQDQAGVFFQACTRANRKLLLTRPYLAVKGESQEPSPFWNAVVQLTGKEKIITIRPATVRFLNEAASPQELVFWAEQFSHNLDLIRKPDFLPSGETLALKRAVLESRLAWPISGKYEGDLSELANLSAGLLPDKQVWSPSSLETYLSCPLRFWVNYTLQVKEQVVPQPGLQAYQLGLVLHSILEQVYLAAEDPSDPQSVLAALPLVARRIFAAAPQEYQFEPTALWLNQQKEWLVALEKTIVALAQDGWQPMAHEQKFGLDGVPPLEIDLAAGEVIRIRGLIDRVDRNATGEIRVVDYKTGSGHLSPDDLINGTRLQLPLYAQAARDAVGLGQPVEGLYWALLAGKEGSLKLSSFSFDDFEGPQGAMRVAANHIQTVLDGLIRKDFHPQVPRGGCPAYCQARLWCWRYSPERR
jgi:ATP-dependent helicase/DNAse subunit B